MRGGIVYNKFQNDLWGIFSAGYIIILILVAVLAYKIAPDSTSNANQMHLSIHSNPPGFKANMLILYSKKKEPVESTFLGGEINNIQEIPITDYKIQSDGVWIQPYG